MEYVNETEFSNEYNAFFNIQGDLLKKKFESRNLKCYLLQNEAEVKDFITNFINERNQIKDIAFSDGVTLYQLGLFDWIKSKYSENYSINQPLERSRTGQYTVYGEEPPGRMNLPYDEWKEKSDKWYEGLRSSLTSDLLIISANAITMNGEIVSIDGIGNRVSGMIFGPRHVLCIVGRNKITKDVEAALERIHNYTVPLTYIRHNLKHWCNFQEVPCIKHGKCVKCNHPESACRNTVIVSGQVKQNSDRIHLLVVNQDLGF
ncbi:MAG: LUD domain-containing protein [Bacteroidia bacterium]